MPADLVLIQSIQSAVEASPENVPLRKHLADLLLAAGQVEAAVQQYRQALDRVPNDSEIKHGLAKAYVQQGKPEVALVVLEDLQRSNALQPDGLILAARLYLDMGDIPSAAKAYAQAVGREPSLADPDLEQRLGGPSLAVETPPEKVTAETPPVKPPVEFVVAQGDDPGYLVSVERPPVTFKDVGGMEKLKEEIRMKIIYPLSHPELFRTYKKSIGGGILMYGPPGCGKTFLARATAGEVQASFIAVGLHDVLDMYLGQSEQNLHDIFEAARAQAPCILFFDEVDALGASRSDMRTHGIRQVINQFLSEMDGVTTSNAGVLILAATNVPWMVDAALRRPGRFDRVLFVPPPDQTARAAILRLMLAGIPVQAVDYNRLAQLTPHFSGADLRGLVDRAVEGKLAAAMRTGQAAPVTAADLQAAAQGLKPTTKEWFETARNYAIYSNEGGLYDDILDYLKLSKPLPKPK